MSNVIDVYFGNSTLAIIKDEKYIYNSGMRFRFPDLDLPDSYQVHFGNSPTGATYERIGDASGVTIPDRCWQVGKTIYAWIYLHPTEDSSVTKYEVRLPVKQRGELPDGPGPSDTEQTVIDQTIAAANRAMERSEAAADRAEAAADKLGAFFVQDGMLYCRHESGVLSE